MTRYSQGATWGPRLGEASVPGVPNSRKTDRFKSETANWRSTASGLLAISLPIAFKAINPTVLHIGGPK